MTQVLGVHGIRQGRKNTDRLSQEWSSGLSAQLFGRLAEPRHLVHVPLLSHLLSPPGDRLGPAGDVDLHDLTNEELTFIESGLLDALQNPDEATLETMAAQGEVLGLPRAPAPLQAIMRAVDRRWRGEVPDLITLLREVNRYLHDPSTAASVRARLVETAADRAISPRILIGHSLGSVIAYDIVRRGDLAVDALVTIGSPLGFSTISRALGAMPGAPRADHDLLVQAWTNIFDSGDAVTGGRGIAQAFAQATDYTVSNRRNDAHSAPLYLAHRETADAVIPWMTARS